jgi:hypothetical protein
VNSFARRGDASVVVFIWWSSQWEADAYVGCSCCDAGAGLIGQAGWRGTDAGHVNISPLTLR